MDICVIFGLCPYSAFGIISQDFGSCKQPDYISVINCSSSRGDRGSMNSSYFLAALFIAVILLSRGKTLVCPMI